MSTQPIYQDALGYYSGRLRIVPDRNELVLTRIYDAWAATGILPLIRHDREDPPTKEEFLEHFLNAAADVSICVRYSDTGNPELAGLGALVDIDDGTAEAATAFMRHVSPEETSEFGRLLLTWGFRDHPELDYIYAYAPATHRAALAYQRRLGFHVDPSGVRGYFKGQPADLAYAYMTRDQYEEKYHGNLRAV